MVVDTSLSAISDLISKIAGNTPPEEIVEEIRQLHQFCGNLVKLFTSNNFALAIHSILTADSIELNAGGLAILERIVSIASPSLSLATSYRLESSFDFQILSILTLTPSAPVALARSLILSYVDSRDRDFQCLAFRLANKVNYVDQEVVIAAESHMFHEHAYTAIECIELMSRIASSISEGNRDSVIAAIKKLELNVSYAADNSLRTRVATVLASLLPH